MIELREITDWDYPNHTYFVDNSQSKLLGFRPVGGQKVMYKEPMAFSTARRKFVKVREIKDTEDPNVNVARIVSPSGNVYFVNTFADGTKTCSCIGFKYHGKCKHLNNA
jgi:hypothetical protein